MPNAIQDMSGLMELEYGSIEARQFITNVGLVTSKGRWGDNIMAAEWVHHMSYNPGIIIISVRGSHATADNIIESGEFGVSLASEEQGMIVKVSGGSTGKEVDKIGMLRELGVELYRAESIDVYMVGGAALNLECKLIKHEEVGDHIMFIGEVVGAAASLAENPIVFRSKRGMFKVGEKIAHDERYGKVYDELLKRYRR